MYYRKYNTFNIDPLTVVEFSNDVLELIDHPTAAMLEFIDAYSRTREAGGGAINQTNANSYEFIPLSIPLLPFANKYKTFLDTILKNVDWQWAVVIYLANSNILMPHTDVAGRTYAYNFPLLNADQSRTCFYQHKDPNFIVRPNQSFALNELEQVAELVYEPLTAYILNVQEIHSVINTNTNPRLVISANLNGNLHFDSYTTLR